MLSFQFQVQSIIVEKPRQPRELEAGNPSHPQSGTERKTFAIGCIAYPEIPLDIFEHTYILFHQPRFINVETTSLPPTK